MPPCVSIQSRDSIAYVGRAIGTVKAAKWVRQLPRDLATEHTKLLEGVLPEEQHEFDRVVAQIRTNVSEWLWLNVLTQKDVEDAVHSLYVPLLSLSRVLQVLTIDIVYQSKLFPPAQWRIQPFPHPRN